MKRILSLFLLLVIIAGVCSGCAAKENKNVQSVEDFSQAKIGVLPGSVFQSLAKEHYPDAKLHQMTLPNLILNLKQGKIDGVLFDKGFFVPLIWNHEALSYINMDMPATEYAVAFSKTAQSKVLMSQINAFIRTQTENGWLNQQVEKWFSKSEPDGSLDMSQLTGENGTLRVATNIESIPFAYLKNEQLCGFDADFIFHFAKEYGYDLKIDLVNFDAILPGLATQRYDLAISGITVTEERRESVLFSEVYYKSPIVMAVLNDTASTDAVKTLADYKNASIGILTGSSHDGTAKYHFPNAERVYFNGLADMIIAMEQEKIDCYIEDAPFVTALIWEGVDLKCLDETIGRVDNGFIFPQGENTHIREQINHFLSEAKADGTIEQLKKKWMGAEEPEEHPDYMALEGENGTIRLAISVDGRPLLYQHEDFFTGFEMELLTLFGQKYGYAFDIEVIPFESIIAGIAAGKYDMGASALNITPEREESVDFSEPYASFDVVMVVKDEQGSTAQTSFFDELKKDFHKTFIRENRWKLIVEGIGVTMLISICAAIGGTLLGFGLYMLSCSNIKLLQALTKGIAKVYSRIIAGTPVVVILMILFYVIFGKIRDMSGIVVAIFCFTLTFGAFVYEHMTVAVRSVDKGQTEAAYALGYTKNKTFFRIIFPQAMTIFFPSYCGQAVELIKATAVVGYISVNDLTKMGDIIRSNTYEAFFPLIATAVIYFLLTWILSALLGLVNRRFEPTRRSAEMILKGVKIK